MLATSGRIELLVASGEGSAYNGCFTQTLMATFENGLGKSGDSLLCADVVPTVTAKCLRQIPEHLSYARGAWQIVRAAIPGCGSSRTRPGAATR